MSSTITITESADKHLSAIIKEQDAQGVMLGVKVGDAPGLLTSGLYWTRYQSVSIRKINWFSNMDSFVFSLKRLCLF